MADLPLTPSLDYRREPPGYSVGAGGDFQNEGYVWWSDIGTSDHGYPTQDQALAGAWHDYKKRHDPPGGEGGGCRAMAWASRDARASAPGRLAPGERAIWAAQFMLVLHGGGTDTLAVRLATRAVQELRGIDVTRLSDDQREAVEQMRGGR
ncbi:MAG: hypothetical protein JNK56_36535 [Myxococcales bacterium]|nr:hypothetical protein [Myxococcales bacterium]